MSTTHIRRTRGAGSIRQRTEGSWQVRYDGPPDESGKPTKVSETVRGSRRDAERVLRERLGAVERGELVEKSDETVAGFLRRWLETYASNLEPRTQQGYRGNIERYVVPQVGGVKLQGLRPHHIQQVYACMLGRGLSHRTVVHAHRVLREALGHAVKWGVLTRNPADATTPPRAKKPQMDMWDVPTIHSFQRASEVSRYRDFYHLAILTGMRRSELCGLKWDNVDLTRARLMVVQKLVRVYGTGLVEGHPKTESSRRSIALSKDAVELLRKIRKQQIEERLAAGPVWQDAGFVFTRPDGRPIDPDAPTHDFTAIVKRLDLPHLTLQGLRHAHATLLLTAGIHPKVVSERLGHSNIAITMDTYSHVMPGLQEAAARAIDERLGTAGG